MILFSISDSCINNKSMDNLHILKLGHTKIK